MSDAIKVGFVPLAAAPRGILVVFCDDSLKVGPATAKALGAANEVVKRRSRPPPSRARAVRRWTSWRPRD